MATIVAEPALTRCVSDFARPPVLESGYRYSRAEFERRYADRPDLKKAELIEGVVYVASPVRTDVHGIPHGFIVCWIGNFGAKTPGIAFSDNGSLRLDNENEPQPDLTVWVPSETVGGAKLDSDGFLTGSPELIVEISASSASYDLHDKKQAYERNGVCEYGVVLTEERRVVWFRLENGVYIEHPAENGIFRSTTFPGLWFDAEALLADDLPRLLATLNQGLATPEHQALVEKLAAVALTGGAG